MTIKELRNLVYEAISQDDMDSAFGYMIDGLKAEGRVWDELEGLRKAYNFLKVRILQKSVLTEDEKIEANRLAGELLDLFPKLSPDDLHKDQTYSMGLISNPILIITHSEAQNLDVQAFGKMLKFSGIEVRNLMSYIPEDGVYDLIIFDNMDLDRCDTEEQWNKGAVKHRQHMQDRIHLMERYLEKTHYYFIHYGPPLFWCAQHHNRIQQADNRLELFGSIHEMLRFLNAFKV